SSPAPCPRNREPAQTELSNGGATLVDVAPCAEQASCDLSLPVLRTSPARNEPARGYRPGGRRRTAPACPRRMRRRRPEEGQLQDVRRLARASAPPSRFAFAPLRPKVDRAHSSVTHVTELASRRMTRTSFIAGLAAALCILVVTAGAEASTR